MVEGAIVEHVNELSLASRARKPFSGLARKPISGMLVSALGIHRRGPWKLLFVERTSELLSLPLSSLVRANLPGAQLAHLRLGCAVWASKNAP